MIKVKGDAINFMIPSLLHNIFRPANIVRFSVQYIRKFVVLVRYFFCYIFFGQQVLTH